MPLNKETKTFRILFQGKVTILQPFKHDLERTYLSNFEIQFSIHFDTGLMGKIFLSIVSDVNSAKTWKPKQETQV